MRSRSQGLPAWRDGVEAGERIIEETGETLVGVYAALRRGATETLRAFTLREAEEIIRGFLAASLRARGEIVTRL
ncbi:MAG: hypothetical protein ACYDA3_10430 [Gaiellaceae bacterium]